MGTARLGFALEDVVIHSLRSSEAMAIHIANVPDRTPISMGRWRLLGFMVYTQHQIYSFSRGVWVRMSAQP